MTTSSSRPSVSRPAELGVHARAEQARWPAPALYRRRVRVSSTRTDELRSRRPRSGRPPWGSSPAVSRPSSSSTLSSVLELGALNPSGTKCLEPCRAAISFGFCGLLRRRRHAVNVGVVVAPRLEDRVRRGGRCGGSARPKGAVMTRLPPAVGEVPVVGDLVVVEDHVGRHVGERPRDPGDGGPEHLRPLRLVEEVLLLLRPATSRPSHTSTPSPARDCPRSSLSRRKRRPPARYSGCQSRGLHDSRCSATYSPNERRWWRPSVVVNLAISQDQPARHVTGKFVKSTGTFGIRDG